MSFAHVAVRWLLAWGQRFSLSLSLSLSLSITIRCILMIQAIMTHEHSTAAIQRSTAKTIGIMMVEYTLIWIESSMDLDLGRLLTKWEFDRCFNRGSRADKSFKFLYPIDGHQSL